MALSTSRSDRTATTPTSSWDPLQELELLQSRIGHLLHGAWPDTGAAPSMDDGVLTLRIHKPQQDQPLRIDVRAR
jgi:hypothetical protein